MIAGDKLKGSYVIEQTKGIGLKLATCDRMR